MTNPTSLLGQVLREAYDKSLEADSFREYAASIISIMRAEKIGLEAAIKAFHDEMTVVVGTGIFNDEPGLADFIATEESKSADAFRNSIERAREVVRLADQ